MALRIEKRLICDECGAASPVLETGDVFGYVQPSGWVQYAKDWIMRDFCCEAHLVRWLSKQEQPLIERQGGDHA